jgi:hypothetical protein
VRVAGNRTAEEGGANDLPRRRAGGGGLGHPRTRALAEHQVSLGGELRVRVHDDPARDLELTRQIPRRGDAGTGLQGSFPDGPAQLSLDLRAERLRPLSADRKEEL